MGPSLSQREREITSIEPRHDLVAQELQRFYYPIVRDLGAAVHLAQDAVEAELLLEFEQSVRDPAGRADDQLLAQRVFVGDLLQTPASGRPVLHRTHAGASGGILQPLAEVAVEIH